MIETHLDGAMDEFKKMYDDYIKDDLNVKYEEFTIQCNYESVEYCIDKFIKAELDYNTPGNRGLGRISDNVPRFGGFYRKQLINLSNQRLIELNNQIKTLLLIGYLVHVIVMEEDFKLPITSSNEKHFINWIPGIYSTNIEEAPRIMNILYAAANNTLTELKKFMENNNLIIKKIFKEDKFDLIVTYYLIAGYGLRARE